jgi:hypothetical protein
VIYREYHNISSKSAKVKCTNLSSLNHDIIDLLVMYLVWARSSKSRSSKSQIMSLQSNYIKVNAFHVYIYNYCLRYWSIEQQSSVVNVQFSRPDSKLLLLTCKYRSLLYRGHLKQNDIFWCNCFVLTLQYPDDIYMYLANFDLIFSFPLLFSAKATSRTKPAKPDHTRRTPGKFEADPTYRSKYQINTKAK